MPAGSRAGTEAARWNRVYLGLYVVYVVGGLGARWLGWIHIDAIWFVDAARHILDGSWRIYEFRPPAGLGIAPPLGVAYAYSPLTALLMAPFVSLADALGGTPLAASVGGADGLAQRLSALPLLAADVLAMEQFRRLVRARRPAVDETVLFLGVLVSLLLTGFLQVSAFRDHQEGLLLLLLLTTLRVTPRHVAWGGVLAGMTLAAKQTAVLELLPIGAVLLWGAGMRGTGWPAPRPAGAPWVWGGLAAGVFGAFMLPPLLADRDAVIYAFFTQEERRVINGPGLPAWIDGGLAALLGRGSPAYALWQGRLLRDSDPALLIVGGVVVVAVLWWNARRGRPVGLRDSRLLALVALGGLLEIVLAKWVTGHYYQVPLALALLWDTVRAAPRPPLIGFAGSLGFRAITAAVDPAFAPPLRDALLFALFAGLAGAALGSALGPERAVEDRYPVASPAGISPAPGTGGGGSSA